MQRMAQIVKIKPEHIQQYKDLHAAVWPEVLATIARCNIANYSIFLREPENLLFAYFEYHGSDYAADQALMAADPATQEWWRITDPQQQPFDSVAEGEWWAPVTEVFHVD
ncbi:MAG: L-rhamnose mutarotase [uncultured Propionibacteriaceae bacterium]|uniref:L-rhamnose mutarotase n=1 Tax=uncultured Propionibacteriaceae bacterium TaxID=257457 RepID=A0A6J4NLL7_9ACTN|nr:MAG: L-rhamnose mutarotase [uncultured Propionibacteriaceae bacterium]